MRRTLALFLPLVAVSACNSTASGSLQLKTGEETDTLTRAPAPTTLTVFAVDSSGNKSTLGSGPVSSTDLDLGNQDQNAVATIEVYGTDASGKTLVYGQSLAIQYGALAGNTLPVFIQRTGELARLPNPPTDARQAPTLAILAGEYLFVGGGSNASAAATTQLYDFATLGALSAPPSLPVIPRSIAVTGVYALLLDTNDARYFDFSQNAVAAASPPSSDFGWADVAGGQAVYAFDTSSQSLTDVWIVGATRVSGTPTQAVLHINPSDTSDSSQPLGALHWQKLSAPRLGAGAAYVPGRGLVVVGGNASAAGVETISAGSSTGSPVDQFPPDGSVGLGASAVPNDSSSLLVGGGYSPTGQPVPTRKLHLDTSTTTPWASPAQALDTAAVYSLPDGNSAVVVGNELPSGGPNAGLAHVYVVTETAATEVPTKVRHVGGRSVASPVGPAGAFLLFGGDDAVESFQPQL